MEEKQAFDKWNMGNAMQMKSSFRSTDALSNANAAYDVPVNVKWINNAASSCHSSLNLDTVDNDGNNSKLFSASSERPIIVDSLMVKCAFEDQYYSCQSILSDGKKG